MNAPNSIFPQDKMTAERKAYEPSMEEILASIRRIIADDQAAVSRRPPAPKEGRPAQEPFASSDFKPPQAATAAEERSKFMESSAAKPEIEALPSREPEMDGKAAEKSAELENLVKMSNFGRDAGRGGERQAVAKPAEAPLLSPATGAAVSTSFNALIASRVFNENLNDTVREMIRPMLKTWLDDNLPILVERLVRAEIERVARGGR